MDYFKMSNMNTKIDVLERINESKDILFGHFSSTLTKEMKMQEWNKICAYSKTIGAISEEKEYKYVRDIFWTNLKRRTLAKIGNAKAKTFTPLDDKVMEIVGKDSRILKKSENTSYISQGQEDMEDYSGFANATIADKINSLNTLNIDPLSPGTPDSLTSDRASEDDPPKTSIRMLNHEDGTPAPKRFKRHATADAPNDENEDETLQKRKQELEMECMKLRNYKMKLEILELERRMNIPRSDFTRGIGTRARDNAEP